MPIPDPDTGRPIPDPDVRPDGGIHRTDLPGRIPSRPDPVQTPSREKVAEPAVPFRSPIRDVPTSPEPGGGLEDERIL